MKRSRTFPFRRARRSTQKEVSAARKAIETLTGKPRARRIGRPRKAPKEKYVALSIRLHPVVNAWLRRKSKACGIPYQTLINQILLKEAA